MFIKSQLLLRIANFFPEIPWICVTSFARTLSLCGVGADDDNQLNKKEMHNLKKSLFKKIYGTSFVKLNVDLTIV